jgi:RNA-directed DNA polymerase
LRSQTVETELQEIAKQAGDHPEWVFTNLAHRMTVSFLREAYHRVNRKASPGVDGMTAEEYGRNLEANLEDLHRRLKAGSYIPPPVRRVWLEKEDGKRRPIGMPTFEDKIVQRAVAMLVGAVYEQDFQSFSHGYRDGHSPHQALAQLRDSCMGMRICRIIDLDVTGFFDNMRHDLMLSLTNLRVNDGSLNRLIGRWLHAGVLDGDNLTHPDTGTPQGGVISPLLANIFLHHVLDEWFVKEVQPRMKGKCFLIRFADDAVIGCELESDAQRLMAVLPKRFARFGLTVHPAKTALIAFRRPVRHEETDEGNGTFDFLGFTHYWAKSRRGYWVVKRRTADKRLRRRLKEIWDWCRDNRHAPIAEQHKSLSAKLRGHFQYYGIRGNYEMLEAVMEHLRRAWRYWLNRRGSEKGLTWEAFEQLETVLPLPTPRIVHAI